MIGQLDATQWGAEAGEDVLSELFHALSQPLTTLRCSLELSLQRPRSEAQYRDTLRRALQQAEEIARLTCEIRGLLQAGDSGTRRQVLPLGAFLREAVADLLPVAESKQVQLSLQGEVRGAVLMDPQHLRQGLFALVDFLLDQSQTGGVAVVQARAQTAECTIWLTSSGKPELEARHVLRWAMARRMLESEGGAVQMDDHGGRLRIELRLPLLALDLAAS